MFSAGFIIQTSIILCSLFLFLFLFQTPCMNKRIIISLECSYPLDGRNQFRASSTTVCNHFQQPKSALGHKSVETCTCSGRLWPQEEKQRVTRVTRAPETFQRDLGWQDAFNPIWHVVRIQEANSALLKRDSS